MFLLSRLFPLEGGPLRRSHQICRLHNIARNVIGLPWRLLTGDAREATRDLLVKCLGGGGGYPSMRNRSLLLFHAYPGIRALSSAPDVLHFHTHLCFHFWSGFRVIIGLKLCLVSRWSGGFKCLWRFLSKLHWLSVVIEWVDGWATHGLCLQPVDSQLLAQLRLMHAW